MKIEFKISDMFKKGIIWTIYPIKIDFDGYFYKIGWGSGNIRKLDYPIRKLFKEAKVARKEL